MATYYPSTRHSWISWPGATSSKVSSTAAPTGTSYAGNAGQVGVKVDGGVFVQGYQGQVVGLVGHPAIQAAVLDDDVGGDVALALHLLPLQSRPQSRRPGMVP